MFKSTSTQSLCSEFSPLSSPSLTCLPLNVPALSRLRVSGSRRLSRDESWRSRHQRHESLVRQGGVTRNAGLRS